MIWNRLVVQKLPYLMLLQNYLRSSDFVCLKLINDFWILYIEFLYIELNDF